MKFAFFLLAVLATGWSELVTRPTPQIPATITEALTVSKGTYSAHFKKQPGRYLIFDWLLTNQSIKNSVIIYTTLEGRDISSN